MFVMQDLFATDVLLDQSRLTLQRVPFVQQVDIVNKVEQRKLSVLRDKLVYFRVLMIQPHVCFAKLAATVKVLEARQTVVRYVRLVHFVQKVHMIT